MSDKDGELKEFVYSGVPPLCISGHQDLGIRSRLQVEKMGRIFLQGDEICSILETRLLSHIYNGTRTRHAKTMRTFDVDVFLRRGKQHLAVR